MPVALNDVFLITMLGRYAGQRVMLTHTYMVTNTGPGVDDVLAMDSLLTAVRGGAGGGDILESAYRVSVGTNYTLEEITCQKIAGIRTVKRSFARNVPGNGGAASLTGNIAAVVTLRTVLAGRTQVSNKHIGPVPDVVGLVTGGFITGAYDANLTVTKNALLVGFTDAVLGVTWAPCIYHRGSIALPSQVTTGVVQQTVRVMRRRTVGQGE